jgi:hypothetical protein
VSAIGERLTKFRKWRESQARVLESKTEDIEKEIAFRTMKAMVWAAEGTVRSGEGEDREGRNDVG